jgi:CRISPR-associated protein Csa5
MMENIAELLAVLVAENESYTYVDKLGYAPSKDLALYYLREALRDFISLKNKPQSQWSSPKAFEEAGKIKMELVEREIESMERISSMKELREAVSLITAKALSIASRLKG